MKRRRAVRLIGALAAAPVFGRFSDSELLALGERIHQRLEHEGHEPRALTPAQLRTVMVAAEHIIPRTDTAGATDAGVATFIDAMLADWYTPAERARFVAGIDELAARHFIAAADGARVALLTEIDDSVTALRRTDAPAANAHWFATLKFLTVWGYCTSRVGITEELRLDLMPGRYDGNAEYLRG